MTRRPDISAPRRMLRRPEAAQYCGVSVTIFDRLVQDGRLPGALRVDGCVLWDIRKIDTAIDALQDNAAPEHNEWDS